MKKSGRKILAWQCPDCKDVVTSANWIRHEMNVCKCGKMSVDYEEHYTRTSGHQLKDIKFKEWDVEDLIK